MSKNKSDVRRPIPPQGLAMVMCDDVWQDPATNKDFILGAFHTIESKEFPTTFPRITIYFVLTGGRGTIPVELRVTDASGDTDLFVTEYGSLDFESPLSVVEERIWLVEMLFPAPGEYRVQLHAAGDLIMERRLWLVYPERI